MFGSGILDLVIGLVFIYFILSLICSAVREIFANLLDLRHAHLRDWLKNIFKDDSFSDEIMNHHLIAGLTTKGKKPSYIPDNIFSTVVFDLFASKWGHQEGENTREGLSFDFEEIKQAIVKSDVLKDDLKRVLVQFAGESDSLFHFRTRVEVWFNQAMSEASGTYKQRSQWWILFVALATTMAVNVDSIAVSKFLYENPEAREEFADLATTFDQDSFKKISLGDLPMKLDSVQTKVDSVIVNVQVSIKEIKAYSELLESSTLPMGWNDKTAVAPFSVAWWTRFFGWMMTAMAVSMGAPFWFDMLNKLSNIRSSSKPPENRTPSAVPPASGTGNG